MKKLLLTTALLILTFGLTAQTRISTADFTEIRVSNAFNVLLIPSDRNEVVIPENLALPDGVTPKDIVNVSNGTLTIQLQLSYQNFFEWRKVRNFENKRKKNNPFITIYFESLDALTLSGAVNAKSEQPIKGTTLRLRLSGASDAKLNVDVNQITTNLSGASDLTLIGKTNAHNLKASGASDAKLKNFESLFTEVSLSGSSDAKISAQKITGNASGASTLYINSNANRNVKTSGASSVKTY